jgi:two-component system, cell cycle sensor histidine kinase and response regulator CckA
MRLYDRSKRLVDSTPDLLPRDPERMAVDIRDGNWELVGGPSAGWSATMAPQLLPLRVAIFACVLLVTLLAAQLDDRDARLKRAVEQRTASIMELVEERSETIRQQKKTEESLAANEERLRLALAAARMGTFEIDVTSGKLSGSSGLREMHGLPVGSKFRSLADVLAMLGEPDREAMRREYERGLRDPATGAMEYRIVGEDGGTRWIGLTWLSRADDAGAVQRIVGTLANITERKNLEEKFLHAQKMEAVGALAGGIAHDFNNLLTVILGAGKMARAAAETLPGTGNVRADIDDVLAAGERAAVLTGQLLAFSRRQVTQPRLFDVGELVGNLTSMLNRLVGEQVNIETVIPGAPMSVFADQGQLTQVLMNLAVNARDAMPEGGRLQIKVHSTSVEDGSPPPAAGLAPGQYAVLSVTDTGEGIDPAIHHLVFDPFFTTKPVGQGTGLGLSTVYGIMVQLGGGVRLTSEQGKGTTVDVFIPLADRAAVVADARDTGAAPPSGGAGLTLLVAEDEPGLQRLVARVLSKAGYRVLMAGDGVEALRAAREHEGDIALLLSDVTMPNMGGVELASELRRERPGTRVLFVSGYPQDVERSGPVNLTDASFLAKPFSPANLLDAVQRALGEPPAASS